MKKRENPENSKSSEDELLGSDPLLAQDLRRLVKASANIPLPEDEKTALWERINSSTQDDGVNWSFWLRIAASIIIVLGISTWFLTRKEDSSIRKFAAQKFKIEAPGETQLILGKSKVLVLEDHAKIAYSEDKLQIKDSLNSVSNELAVSETSYNTLIVPYGRRSQVTLEDGTQVWLNSGSRLIYPVSFSVDKREVFLDGEAYFDVAHKKDSPFYLHTDKLKIKVLGTQFNITSYSDDKEDFAALVKGSIELEILSDSKKSGYRMIPGNLAVYRPQEHKLRISNANLKEYTSWKDGYLFLEQMPLHALVKKLTRYYNTNLYIDPKVNKAETFSGRLDLQTDITNVMEFVCAGTAYMYDSKERRLTLRKP